jgi:hypothetical protein
MASELRVDRIIPVNGVPTGGGGGVIQYGGLRIMSELRTNKIYPRDGLPAGASGGSNIHISSATYNGSTATDWAPIPVWYLHSPATTSPVTYTLYCKPSGTSTTDFGWAGNSRYPFVLREVSG